MNMQVKGMTEDCIGRHKVQLDVGDEPRVNYTLGSVDVWTANDSIIKLPFNISTKKDCNITVFLVNDNGIVSNKTHVDCRKLLVPA